MSMEIKNIADLREVFGAMREAGCARLVVGTVTLELAWPHAAPASAPSPRERVEGTGTVADGLPVDHPGLRGIKLPEKAGG